MEDYELFQCNMLQIEESKEKAVFPPEYGEYKEGEARVDEAPMHQFEKDKPIKHEESKLKVTNLGTEEAPKNILVGDDWDPVLKATTVKIFLEYKDVFAWTYKDLKGVPREMCVHRIQLVP